MKFTCCFWCSSIAATGTVSISYQNAQDEQQCQRLTHIYISNANCSCCTFVCKGRAQLGFTFGVIGTVIKALKEVSMSVQPAVEERSIGNFTWKYVPIELGSADSIVGAFRTNLLPFIRPNWNPDKLDHTVFDGGTSNFLVGIYEEGRRCKDQVLVRRDGQGTEIFVNRESEIVTITALHQAGLAPPLYCSLKNGICYGFAKGRNLTVSEMQDSAMMKRTAQALAKLHTVEIPAPLRGQTPLVWAKCDRWLGQLPGEYKDPEKNDCFNRTIGSLEVLRQELKRLKTEISCCQSPVVFCHSDMNGLNLIYNSEEDAVTMIDFEFSGPNYLAFDIGNHFCEFAGLDTVDYNLYPDEALQKLWIGMYLEEAARLKGEEPGSVTDAAVHLLYREANKFALVSHLFWCIWALLQGALSDIDFNYVGYAGTRFAEFQRRKEAFYPL